jgi:small-conductance mechanosensitive channel
MTERLQNTITAIFAMSNDELEQVILAVKQRRQFLSRTNIRSVRVGDRVSFNSSRAGRGTITGEVTKVNVKNVRVKQDNSFTTWNVPANMLTVLA